MELTPLPTGSPSVTQFKKSGNASNGRARRCVFAWSLCFPRSYELAKRLVISGSNSTTIDQTLYDKRLTLNHNTLTYSI